MEKPSRADWKRHSAPYNFTFDYALYKSSVSEVFDQAMEAFTDDAGGSRRYMTLGRERKKSAAAAGSKLTVFTPDTTELSTNQFTPGVLKIFGDTILQGVQYKSVLASCRSTAQELVKQALERFGLPPGEHQKFVLCDVVGKSETGGAADCDSADDARACDKWERIFVRILADRDKPLLLQKFWIPIDGYSRRYELHERDYVTDVTDDDDTLGLNENARKILMSKLRPGAIPLFDPSNMHNPPNGLNMDVKSGLYTGSLKSENIENEYSTAVDVVKVNKKICADEISTRIPSKHPYFLNIRGFDVHKDKTVYVIKSKRFVFGNAKAREANNNEELPKYVLHSPDIEETHCNFKVYRFKKSNGTKRSANEQKNNYFLELEPVANNVSVNGHLVESKTVIKSGDILQFGIYYVLLFKDCSKGFDIPLSLAWLPPPESVTNNNIDGNDNADLRLTLGPPPGDDEAKSSTDESVDVSVPEKMTFPYLKEKEEELVKYICAIIQQQNTCTTYSLTLAYVFSMCVEYASRKFERRQLKHLFLRVLFTVRENVAETAKSLSASKFSCTLLDSSLPQSERDQKLERLLLWISNCVQLLLFLKHTFQLPEVPSSERGTTRGRGEKSPPRKEDNTKHALGQLITGLEEIIMFCFQQSVYTLTKALHPLIAALLNSNPFHDGNSEQCSMEDMIRLFETLAEVTHSVMLHEGITRQLFTYLFFFANTIVFNKLMVEEAGTQYYNWQSGVCIRANLSQLEDWATQNGLEDEFGQMFEKLLAAAELLATSKSTLVKYPWQMMKTHYQPLTPSQLNHLLSNYQLGSNSQPIAWVPSQEDIEVIQTEAICGVNLSSHPPFALPDNCGIIDLIRSPEDASFWTHLRRLKSLYGDTEDDSDSGFSISNTPRGSSLISKAELEDAFYAQENRDEADGRQAFRRHGSQPESALISLLQKNKTRIPVKKSNTNPWSFKIPKSGTGICECTNEKCNKETESEMNVAVDLMKEETRNNLEASECSKEVKDNDIIAAIQARSIKVNAFLKDSHMKCKSGNTDDVTNSRNVREHSGNVADCSARTLPRLSLPRQRLRSNSASGKKLKVDDEVSPNGEQTQSHSLENINGVFKQKHKPSDSFIKAIERGRPRELCKRKDKCSVQKGSANSSVNSAVLNNSIDASDDSLEGDNEVFIEENGDGKHFKDTDAEDDDKNKPSQTTVGCTTLKNKPKHLKGIRGLSQKLLAVSFDSESSRRSSIELTKDELFVDDIAEQDCQTTDAHVLNALTSHDIPQDMFTEVSESTLAAMKRHGSSLNVAPSCDNSPRSLPTDVNGETDADDKKRMSPCPLFTVYIKKGISGIGLGIIDGLHTPLRLSGIYIRKILPGSPASENGCLQVGDRILAVNGKSVIGASHQSTLDAIKASGETLTLLVARGNDSMARKVSAVQL